jgi:hypothetical protein
MGVAQYNGNQDIKTTRKYFNGTTVLRKGQILHYDQAASKTDADPKLQLGNVVKAVSASNVKYLAGIVPDTEAGKTGPCWVEILQPQAGDVLDIEVDGTTDVAAGDFLEPDGTLGALIKGTAAAGDGLFVAFEANTTDATKTVNRCQKV